MQHIITNSNDYHRRSNFMHFQWSTMFNHFIAKKNTRVGKYIKTYVEYCPKMCLAVLYLARFRVLRLHKNFIEFSSCSISSCFLVLFFWRIVSNFQLNANEIGNKHFTFTIFEIVFKRLSSLNSLLGFSVRLHY